MVIGLASLPPDALVSVLCRCPASDHSSLRNTCRAVRSALDSAAHRSERAVTGWAEVRTRLVPGEELYDRYNLDGPELTDDEKDADGDSDGRNSKKRRMEEKRMAQRREEIDECYSELGYYDSAHGYHDVHHDVFVDGAKAGEISMVVIPRDGVESSFHEATDEHSRELQEVGCTLCDARGRPRVKSIKDADADGTATAGGYLHVREVRIDDAHRPGECTGVVARAVRSAASCPELRGRWTLATAVSDARVYMTKEEEEAREDRRLARSGEVSREEWERIRARWRECSLLDARTFLRAGYRQIPEVVDADKDKPVWLFALPWHLREPVLTFEEAASVKLRATPELPPKPRGADDELLQLVKKSSNSIRQALDCLTSLQRELDQSESSFRSNLEEMEQQAAPARAFFEGERPAQMPKETWEESKVELKQLEDLIEGFRVKNEEMLDRMRQNIANEQQAMGRSIEPSINELRTAASALVEQRGASVRKSFAIHCASRLRIPKVVDLLLDLVPPRERTLAVLDQDFSGGSSPLHCALMGTPELQDVEEYYGMASHLLELGADPNNRDPFGVSPLGQYRSVMSSRFEFAHTFGLENVEYDPDKWRPFHDRMEQVLKVRTETDADREARPLVLNDGIGWDINEDDDDVDDMDDSDDDHVDDMDENNHNNN